MQFWNLTTNISPLVCSDFSDIFDVDWFISHLTKDVKIIKELPLRRGQNWVPHTRKVPRKCNEKCYLTRLLPEYSKKHVCLLLIYGRHKHIENSSEASNLLKIKKKLVCLILVNNLFLNFFVHFFSSICFLITSIFLSVVFTYLVWQWNAYDNLHNYTSICQ